MFPSPSELQYFLEVADKLNMSRAAERLGISQPALTMAIQRLETSLGQKILLRSKTGVQLTKAGQRLEKVARNLLSDWNEIKTATSRDSETIQGRYTLGCHPSVGMYTLPYFLPQLLEKYPDLEMNLSHGLSRKITEEVVSHQIDFGIVVNPVRHPDLVIKTLLQDEVTLWVSAQNKSSNQDPTSKDVVLLCDPDLLQSQHILRQLSRKGLSFKRMITSSSLEVITELTASGAGIGIIPGRVVAQNKAKSLKPLHAKDALSFKDSIALIYRADFQKTAASQIILSTIHKAFEQ